MSRRRRWTMCSPTCETLGTRRLWRRANSMPRAAPVLEDRCCDLHLRSALLLRTASQIHTRASRVHVATWTRPQQRSQRPLQLPRVVTLTSFCGHGVLGRSLGSCLQFRTGTWLRCRDTSIGGSTPLMVIRLLPLPASAHFPSGPRSPYSQRPPCCLMN